MPAFRSPSTFRSARAFGEHLKRLAPDFALDLGPFPGGGALGSSAACFGRRLENRFCVHPMEGWDGTRKGEPSDDTCRRWRRFGRSGAALIWGGEAIAVQYDGRANPNQLCVDDPGDATAFLRALLGEIRRGRREVGLDPDGATIGLQLTHSGRFSRPDGTRRPKAAFRHPVLDQRCGISDDTAIVSDRELIGIADRFVIAARAARDAGFHFVDVKCCHGYLLHELLAAHTRRGAFGGSFENRTAIFRRIVDGIRDACPDLGIGVRISLHDVLPHRLRGDGSVEAVRFEDAHLYAFGLDAGDPSRPDLKEPLAFLRLARALGVNAVNVTLGSPYAAPHVQRPAAYPPCDGYPPPEDPLLGVLRHLRATRAAKDELPDVFVVGSGYTYLQEYLPHVAHHEVSAGRADSVGLGRAMLSYPELPLDFLAGRPLDRKRLCRTFSDCTTGPRQGLPSGCYPLDPHYRERPEAARLREIRREMSPSGGRRRRPGGP